MSSDSHSLLSDLPYVRQSAEAPAVPVLFIVGYQRSGTTLLDRLLGNSPELLSGGELLHIWAQGLVADRHCSCGARFSDCSFWQTVGHSSFSSLTPAEVNRIAEFLSYLTSTYRMWRLFTKRTRHSFLNSAPANFYDITERLYRNMLDVSARQVVVDSTKAAAYLMFLAQIRSIDIHVVHLVRDPRAVAHSLLRHVEIPYEDGGSLPRHGAVRSAVLWLIWNAAAEWVARRLGLPYTRIRYEDLVRSPDGIISDLRTEIIGQHADLDREREKLSGDENTELAAVHTMGGNPMRFQRGRIRIVEDTAWTTGSRTRQVIVGAITLPLRWRYGYRTVPGRSWVNGSF